MSKYEMIHYAGLIIFCWLLLASNRITGQLHEKYVGCFEGNGNNTKSEIAQPGANNLTIEICIQECYKKVNSEMTFAALINGKKCMCRNDYGQRLSDRKCDAKCSGNQLQFCGGASAYKFYSLYTVCPVGYFGQNCDQSCHCKRLLPCDRKTGMCPDGCEDQWTGTNCNTSDSRKQYIGCYGDRNQDKAMDVENPDEKTGKNKNNANSIEFCIEICSANNFTYAGMQYGYDCSCGEKYDKYGDKKLDGTQVSCNFSCPANRDQICGGEFANSVYYVCPIGFYGRDCVNRCNCFNGGPCRFNGSCLISTLNFCKPGWTGSACNFRDCKVNNGDCGTKERCETIDLGYANTTSCSIATNCNVDNGDCGIEERCETIDLGYANTTACQPVPRTLERYYIGCFHTTDMQSTKQTDLRNATDLTLDACIVECRRQTLFTYAGVVNGSTCFCSDTYGIQLSESNCGIRCTGSSSQFCGGMLRIGSMAIYSVYTVCPVGKFGHDCRKVCRCKNQSPCNRFKGACTKGCSGNWTRASCNKNCGIDNGDCESDENCQIVDLGFANVSVCRCKEGSYRDNNTCRPTSLHYVGCYNGSIAQYSVIELPTNDTLTIEFCIQSCRQLNKTYSILQGGTTCLCGDDYGQISPDSDCRVPCAGNKLQYCGGRNTVDGTPIYAVYTAKSFLRQYIGCYNDSNSSAMEKKFSRENGQNNTIEFCMRQCAYENYTYFGMQYGYDCYCGDSYDRDGLLPESSCNMTCPGNPGQKCGGNYANSVYAVTDILWCSSDADCKSNEACTVIDLKYMNISRCRCKQGLHRMSIWENCTEIDECRLGTSTCDPISENCVKTIEGYYCECRVGFLYMSCKSEDIDECRNGSQGCNTEPELCNNTHGSYACNCKSGYENMTFGNCTDIDECQSNTSTCDQVAEYCVNSIGSYRCECKDGFVNMSGKCEDIDECRNNSHRCNIESEQCNNTHGSYICNCKPGYENMTFGNCTDIDECRSGASLCDLNSTYCLNNVGSYTCECKDGFVLKSGKCVGQLHEKYVGCFVGNGKNQKSKDVLSGANNLTIEICIQKCYNETDQANSEMTFGALMNGRRCICRNDYGRRLSDRKCDVKCSGNHLQFCGGTGIDKFYSLYTVCPVGYFGQNCNQSCRCKRHLPCDRKTGMCPDGCEEQWSGTHCGIHTQYIGCYGDGPAQAMDVKNPGGVTGHNKPNSFQICMKICSENKYTYAGLQYGYDCWCGEKYDRYGNKTYHPKQVNCNFPCELNRNEMCGGDYANSVYYVCPIGFHGQNCSNRCNCSSGGQCRFNGSCLNCRPGWTGSACNIRDCKVNNGDCGTEERCETIDLGYANTTSCSPATNCKVDNGDCGIEEQCETIDLGYAKKTVCQPIPRKLERYYVGCFLTTDIQSMRQTGLKNATDLTLDACIVECRRQTLLTYAGVVNGRMCFCSDTYDVQLSDSNCGIRCTGSNSQFCGGILRTGSMAIYSAYTVCPVGNFGHECRKVCHCKNQSPCNRITGDCTNGCSGNWTGASCDKSKVNEQYIGCYNDTNVKAMDESNPGEQTGHKKSSTNNVEFCMQICSWNNYAYAGMQYAYDCNCGNRYHRYGALSDTHCNRSCPSNSRQICGGHWANSVYYTCPRGFYGRNCASRIHSVDGRPCINGSCSCKTGWIGVDCNIRDCGVSNGDCESDEKCQIVDLGFANLSVCRCKDGLYRDSNTCRPTYLHYVGCYKGNIAQYVALELPSTDALTVEFCIQRCRQLNKTYSILQGGVTCLCGDDYGQILPDSDCRVPCAGNKLQYCGGSNTVDGTPIYVVYQSTKSLLRQYIGCYKDENKPKLAAMERKFSWSNGNNNTIESCTRHCAYHNYSYAGLQYGYDCFCGNSYDRYGPLPESNCSIKCSGNHSQRCGGNFANSVYAVNDIFWCSSDADCKKNEACTVIDLKYVNISRCRCKQGFHRMTTWEYCTDIDECQSNTSTCDPVAENCVNNIGSYKCECMDGFVNMSGKCEDIDECSKNSHECNIETELCNNTRGSYVCHCKPGYENMTFGNCTDIDECQTNTSTCDPVSQYCVNNIGSHRCECRDGFANTSGKCEDIDECQLGRSSPRCDAISEDCVNIIGNFTCKCKEGLKNMSGKCEAEPNNEPNNAMVISLVFFLVVIVIVAVVLVWFQRKRIFAKKETSESKTMVSNSNHKQDKAPSGNQETSLHIISSKQASIKIPVGELPALLKTKRSQPGALEKEFKSVPVEDSTKTCREGKKKELKHRNRFQNIIPYDENRVILRKHHNQFSDYINASFIKSYNSEEKLIATQGPNPDTLTDFWQMIFENDVGTIVMITNLVENAKKKCACYWPEPDESLTFEDITIKLKLTESWPNYVIRHLQLVKGSCTRDIKQWHFTVWPDHGVPSDVKGFLNFRRNVRQCMSWDKYTIVHCSAGVGRTGTFIAINYLLEQAEAEGVVDILGCLCFLRQQRPHMIQTLDQYEFIYTALATEFTIGKTAIKPEDFDTTYQNLLVRDKLSRKTQLEIQFQVLQEQWSHQGESENPFHVFPKSMDMSDISEDAQAVFVQSWKTKDAYIVPEYPDKNTINYFWTICLDYECKLVIYLNNSQKLQPFFPKQPAEWLNVDCWRLQCKSSDREQYVTRLKVALSHISESEYANTAISTASGEITLLNVMVNGNGTRLNYDALYSAYKAIKALGSKSGANKSPTPVVIVSGPNCQLSGLYIAAFNAFDMLAESKEVDLYQVVYDIKKSRSKLIASLDTYEELHGVVNHRIGYTSSATIYSNV